MEFKAADKMSLLLIMCLCSFVNEGGGVVEDCLCFHLRLLCL